MNNLPRSFFCLLTLSVLAGCNRQGTMPEKSEPVRISTMTNVYSEWLKDLTNQAPFEAEILGTSIQESPNFLTNQTTVVSNHYLIVFRSGDGRERALRGVNVPPDQLQRVKGLEKGKSYTFPTALLK